METSKFYEQSFQPNQELFVTFWKEYYETNQSDTKMIQLCSTIFQAANLIQDIDQAINTDITSKIKDKLKQERQSLLGIIKILLNNQQKTSQYINNQVVYEKMQQIATKLQNFNDQSLDVALESFQDLLKSQIQKNLKKSIYKQLFLLINSKNLACVYIKLYDVSKQFKNKDLKSFIDKICIQFQKKHQKLIKIIERKDIRQKNSNSILESFKDLGQQEIRDFNKQNAKNKPQFKGTRSPQDQILHERIQFYTHKVEDRNQQAAIFCQLLKNNQKLKKISLFIQDKRQIKQQSIKDFFKGMQKQLLKMEEYYKFFKKYKQSKNCSKARLYIQSFLDIYKTLINSFKNTEDYTIILNASKELNEVFDKFCQAIDQQFQYQVNTQLANIRFGIVLPLLILYQFVKPQQHDQLIQKHLPEQAERCRKDIMSQFQRQIKIPFHYNFRIIEINFHGYRGSKQNYHKKQQSQHTDIFFHKTIPQLIKEMYKYQKPVVLLFLIGGYHPQDQPHWRYKYIYHQIMYHVVNLRSERPQFKLSLKPKKPDFQQYSDSEQYLNTYHRPYFYLSLRLYNFYPNIKWKSKGQCSFYIGQR